MVFHHGKETTHSYSRRHLSCDDRFIEDAMLYLQTPFAFAPDLDAIIASVCEQYAMTEAELSAKGRARRPAEARAVIGYLAVNLNSGTVSEVSRRFGRDIATLSGGISRIRREYSQTKSLINH